MRRTADGRRTKKRPGNNDLGRNTDPSRCPQRSAGKETCIRFRDLPYCAFAVLAQVFFAGSASAPHFSNATLYSASRFSTFAFLLASACFTAPSWRVSFARGESVLHRVAVPNTNMRQTCCVAWLGPGIPSSSFSAARLNEIVAPLRRNNERNHLSGMLLFTGNISVESSKEKNRSGQHVAPDTDERHCDLIRIGDHFADSDGFPNGRWPYRSCRCGLADREASFAAGVDQNRR